jgi:hypothetical protein
MQLRVPLDPKYTSVVGKAIYVFAYYEWAIIYIIEQYKSGFVLQYCREKTMTSGVVKDKLQAIVNDLGTDFTKVSQNELQACCAKFAQLIVKRNALIHAHPITDSDGSQILNYQSKPSNPLPDMKWPVAAVSQALSEFDAAACEANALLYRLK